MRDNIKKIALSSVFAALVFIATAYLPRVPFPGGYIHLGDVFIYIAACILPLPYSAVSAAAGAAAADILTGYMIWAPATFVVKAALAALFSSKNEKFICKKNIAAIFFALFVSIGGYYFYEALIISSFAVALESVPFNLMQGIGSGALFVLLGLAFDRTALKKKIYGK